MHFNSAERNELTPVFDFPKYNLWEEGEEGFLKAYINTLGKVLFRTGEFFSNSKDLKGWLMPLLFGVISESIGMFFNIVYSKAAISNYGEFFRFIGGIQSHNFFLISSLALLLYFPLAALFMHIGVFILGGVGGLNRTFRVLTYSSSASILYVIPYAGALFSFIFRIYIILKGYKVFHEFSILRSISALLVPPVLLFIVILLLFLIPLAIVGAGFLKNFIDLMQIFG
jgi:hypothetical protein